MTIRSDLMRLGQILVARSGDRRHGACYLTRVTDWLQLTSGGHVQNV